MSRFSRTRPMAIAASVAGAVLLAVVCRAFVPTREVRAGPGIGGPFALVSQDGAPVTQRALEGHPTLVFFGYTHCPNVCPATLSEITDVFKSLDADPRAAREARALFVTVDPERDTPEVLKDYMSNFDPRIVALSGTREQVDVAMRAYRAYAKAVPDGDGDYTMDHTAFAYLMDKTGAFVGPFDLDRTTDQAAADLRKYF